MNMLLKISSLARSTFYYHLNASKTDKYSEAKQAIEEVFSEHDGRYGYRRITDELRTKGIKLNHKTVLKLMKCLNIHGKMRKNEKYHSYKGEVGKVADNLLQRDFNATEPFEKLATDVTQFKVKDKKIYLSPIMDLYNNEIVAYSISLHPDLAQTREMLEELSKRLPQGAKPVLHSDQGWQYQHAMFQRYLEEHHITQSMSRKGNCMDNGAMVFLWEIEGGNVLWREVRERGRFHTEVAQIHIILEQREDFSQTKRNESGTIPNPFQHNLIIFCPNFGVHFSSARFL